MEQNLLIGKYAEQRGINPEGGYRLSPYELINAIQSNDYMLRYAASKLLRISNNFFISLSGCELIHDTDANGEIISTRSSEGWIYSEYNNSFHHIPAFGPVEGNCPLSAIISADYLQNETTGIYTCEMAIIPENTDEYPPAFKDRVETTPFEPLFDYIVDSDETLRGLDNNTKAKRVFVKKGSFVSDRPISIMPNVEIIKGDVGAEIIFRGLSTEDTGDIIGLLSCNEPNPKLKVCDLTIMAELDNLKSFRGAVVRGISNISDCALQVTVPVTNDNETSFEVYGFHKCSGLENCSTKSQTIAHSTVTGYFSYTDYMECSDIRTCKAGDGTNIEISGNSVAFGFRNCKNIYNAICSPSVNTGTEYSAFKSCDSINGAEVSISSMEGNNIKCFDICYNIIDCCGEIVAEAGKAVCFSNCFRLRGCSGSTINSSGTVSGSVFSECNGVICCNAESIASMISFNECYGIRRCQARGDGEKYISCYASSSDDSAPIVYKVDGVDKIRWNS